MGVRAHSHSHPLTKSHGFIAAIPTGSSNTTEEASKRKKQKKGTTHTAGLLQGFSCVVCVLRVCSSHSDYRGRVVAAAVLLLLRLPAHITHHSTPIPAAAQTQAVSVLILHPTNRETTSPVVTKLQHNKSRTTSNNNTTSYEPASTSSMH